jgi:putative holliday junction resolvase
MRRGIRLGVDLGDVRIGVARSDADGLMAVPVTTVPRGPGDHAAIALLVREWEALEVLVGLPLRMDGTEGPAVGKIREWVHAFRTSHPEVPVRLIDERLSTVQATAQLRQSGRTSRQSRSIVDQAAAVVIVESALARERATGQPAGIEP